MTEITDSSDVPLADEFEQLLSPIEKAEASPVDWHETIPLPAKLTDQERAIILESGVTQDELSSGAVTRQQLWDAGFSFINAAGGAEKPLLSVRIENGDQILDASKRTLLAPHELEQIRQYLLQHGLTRDYSQEEIREIRGNMLAFMFMSEQAMEQAPAAMKNAMLQAIREIYASEIADKAKEFLSDKLAEKSLGFLVQECCQGLGFSKVLGIPVDMMRTRRTSLHGAASPFLDSGYHFDDNPDVTLFPDDPTKTRRLNMMVVHLMSKGLCEIGSSLNGSHDQTYLSPLEFERFIDDDRPEDTSNSPKEVVQTIVDRLRARIDPENYIEPPNLSN